MSIIKLFNLATIEWHFNYLDIYIFQRFSRKTQTQMRCQRIFSNSWWKPNILTTIIFNKASDKLKNPTCLHANLFQSCPTLCNPMDCSPWGSSVHGILQTRILEWVAMPSSRGSSQPRDWTHISCSSCIADRFFTTEPPGEPELDPSNGYLLSTLNLF